MPQLYDKKLPKSDEKLRKFDLDVEGGHILVDGAGNGGWVGGGWGQMPKASNKKVNIKYFLSEGD
jgi:hypothetical protein